MSEAKQLQQILEDIADAIWRLAELVASIDDQGRDDAEEEDTLP